MKLGIPKLCYIDKYASVAYFTTQEVTAQWGDDWDDPLDNSSAPYDDFSNRVDPKWLVLRVIYDPQDFESAHERTYNTSETVQSINKGNIPWLTYSASRPTKESKVFFAGMTIFEFTHILGTLGIAYALPKITKAYIADTTPPDGYSDGPFCPHCSMSIDPVKGLMHSISGDVHVVSCSACMKIITVLKA